MQFIFHSFGEFPACATLDSIWRPPGARPPLKLSTSVSRPNSRTHRGKSTSTHRVTLMPGSGSEIPSQQDELHDGEGDEDIPKCTSAAVLSVRPLIRLLKFIAAHVESQGRSHYIDLAAKPCHAFVIGLSVNIDKVMTIYLRSADTLSLITAQPLGWR
jgi:hypothetical protein